MGSSATPKVSDLSAEAIREMASAFQKSRLLLTAFELGVFNALGDRSGTAAEVAAATDADVRATERLLNALCAVGLLEKEGELFANTSASSQFLVRGKPGYMAGLMHTVNLWDTWGSLTETVRQGHSVATSQIGDRGPEWLTAFIAAMHDRAAKQAESVASVLDLSAVSRILDVGGGSGAYSMGFVRAGEGVTAVVFDLPTVVPLAKGYIEAAGLSDRIDTKVGDYLTDGFGSGFDLVFLSAIVHINSYEQNADLVRRCAEALQPGGQVVVQDFVMDEGRTRPVGGALFSLNMLVGTECGDTYTEAEIRDWMTRAGLSEVIRRDTSFGTTLLIGRR